MIPQGAIVAIRRSGTSNVRATSDTSATLTAPLPIARDAALFLIEARDTIGFAVETSVNLSSDRTAATQLALHGNYIVEGTRRVLFAARDRFAHHRRPGEKQEPGEAPVRILAMVR